MRKRTWILGAATLSLGLGATQAVRAQVYYAGQYGAGNTWNVYETRGQGILTGSGRQKFVGGATFNTGNAETWLGARAAADTLTFTLNGTTYNGHMVTFADPTTGPLENDFIANNPSAPSGDHWIGLSDGVAFGGVDTGVGDTHNDRGAGWAWQAPGETYVDIGRWGDGEPNDAGDGEDAVHMRGDNLWNDNGNGGTGQSAPVMPYVMEYETHLATQPSLPGLPALDPTINKTPGPLSTTDGKMAIREVINNGGVSGNAGALRSLFSADLNPSATVRDYEEPVLNIANAGGGASFGGDQDFGVVRFGDTPGGDLNNVAIRAAGRIRIPEGQGGTYTFQFNSDDSGELWIYGKTFTNPTSASGDAGTAVTPYGSLVFANDRGPGDSLGQVTLEPGDYDFEFVGNENGGGAEFELSAAKGAFTTFDNTKFQLVGAPAINYNATIPKVDTWNVREVIRLPEQANPDGTANPAADPKGPLNTLAQAKDLFDNKDADDLDFTGTVAFLNMADPDAAGGGNFGNNIPFLNNLANADDNDFVFKATANLEITTAGEYSFFVNSDDGAELTIDGASFTVQSSGVTAVLNNNGETVTLDALTGASATLVTTTLSAGSHAIEMWMFERGGGAFAELSMAAGTFTSFDSRFFAPIGNVTQNITVNQDPGLQLVKQTDAGVVGDTNGDGKVDLDDLNNVRNNFGGTGIGDTNGDGNVDLDDLNNVRNNFGATGAPSSVPEPSSFALIGLGLAGLFGLRRFRK